MDAKEELAGVSISEQDQKDILDLYTKIRAAEAKLVGPDGKTQLLPTNLYSFLCQVLGDLKAGKSVTILQSNAELTTIEAAKLLAVSRQFLVQLWKRTRCLITWSVRIGGCMRVMFWPSKVGVTLPVARHSMTWRAPSSSREHTTGCLWIDPDSR